MGNDVVDMEHISDDTKSKLRDFDEQEAYFMLCEIFANAQATKDYARFQSDLENWKKRFPIDLFSEQASSNLFGSILLDLLFRYKYRTFCCHNRFF